MLRRAIAALLILVCLLLFARHIPIPTGLVYAFVAVGFIVLTGSVMLQCGSDLEEEDAEQEQPEHAT